MRSDAEIDRWLAREWAKDHGYDPDKPIRPDTKPTPGHRPPVAYAVVRALIAAEDFSHDSEIQDQEHRDR